MTYFTPVGLENKNPAIQGGKVSKLPSREEVLRSCQVEKLKMFTSFSKTKTVSTQRRTMILKADRSLFRRMIITGQRRKIEVKDKLQHSLGPMPWALSKAEDFPQKNNKAALAS